MTALQILRNMRQVSQQEQLGLTEIFSADVNLVIWQRSVSRELLTYAEQLVSQDTSNFSSLQSVATPAELSELLEQRLPDGFGKKLMLEDIVLQAEMLTCLMDCSAVGFRLKRLDQPMCPRFHTDHIAVRLLLTYAGAGTEWLSQPPPPQQRQASIDFQQIELGDVALLKGSGWENNQQGAIWHRSPTSMAPRLLLSLDPVGEH